MKVRLMHPQADIDLAAAEPPLTAEVERDLQLAPVWDAMADGDAYLRAVARAAVLHPLRDAPTIRYRQAALADCARRPDDARRLYRIAVDALDLEHAGLLMLPVHGRPDMVLARSLRLLTGLADALTDLSRGCAEMAGRFSSPAFTAFFDRIAGDLDDDYLRLLRRRVRELSFPAGQLMSVGIGDGGEVVDAVLRRAKDANRGLFDRTPLHRPLFSFTIPERDEGGFNALSALRDRSVADVAAAAARSVEHVLAFFAAVRHELGFYLGALNLAAALGSCGAPLCTPDPDGDTSVRATGLYDPALALVTGVAPVGNDVDLGARALLVITGANHGGKSTMLRALGTAQLMMQAGLFVAAESFAARPVGAVLTHGAREQDEQLRRGTFDEELERMSRIVDVAAPGDLLLCNESFAATDEAEGAQILLDVTRALVAAGLQVRSVTHLYDFAREVYDDGGGDAGFLRAERGDDGARPFRLAPAPPLRTSFGLDVYDREFGTNLAAIGEQTAGISRGRMS